MYYSRDVGEKFMRRLQKQERCLYTASHCYPNWEIWAKIGPYWPKDADPLAPGSFVHLALHNSFEVDRSQIATRDEEKLLEKLETTRQLKEVRERNDSGSP